MAINYKHSENIHTLTGPQAALPILFPVEKPASLLDIGCGTGTWLKAAIDFGIHEVAGVDGVELSSDKLHVSAEFIQHQDLTLHWDLKRKFDAVICLEVAEHLEPQFAQTLVETLVNHGDQIYFSAACPGQIGQHHVNCQWPAYWQQLFNEQGYVCEDDLRWTIWEDSRIEPWYRQNLIFVRRAPKLAGKEPRIKPVVHPGIWNMVKAIPAPTTFEEHICQVEQGRMPMMWNLSIPVQALRAKLKRKLKQQ